MHQLAPHPQRHSGAGRNPCCALSPRRTPKVFPALRGSLYPTMSFPRRREPLFSRVGRGIRCLSPKPVSTVIARLVRAIHAAAGAQTWITRTSRVMTIIGGTATPHTNLSPTQIPPHTPSIFRDTGGTAATSVRRPAGGGEVALRSGSSGRGNRAGATANAGVCDRAVRKSPGTPRRLPSHFLSLTRRKPSRGPSVSSITAPGGALSCPHPTPSKPIRTVRYGTVFY